MTDKEKHEWCWRQTGFIAVILPPSLYKLAEEAGYDMRWFVESKPLPTA